MLKVLTEPQDEFKAGAVVTLGNFDGVHLGHQALIRELQKRARARELPLVIILFEPQPAEFFSENNPPARLMTWIEKIKALEPLFQDDDLPAYVLTLHFNQDLAALSADEFIHQVLLHELNAKHILVGRDFRFGHERRGDFETLCHAGKEHDHDFTVSVFDDLLQDNIRISSTEVRTALLDHDLVKAENLLGRPYSMQGEVLEGDKRGRQLGFPTANIALNRLTPAVRGVFAVKVKGLKQAPIEGVANLGVRPTVDGTKAFLEVYLFDFDESIYGLNIEVEFVQFIREEKKFESLDLLKEWIAEDVKKAREIFGKFPSRGGVACEA